MKIYLAGPMRGIPAFNFPEFNYWTARLREQDHVVFNPAESDENNGFNPSGLQGTDAELEHAAFDLRSAIVTDLTWIGRHAEAVAVLDGWEVSSGADLETRLAWFLSLPVYPVGSLYAWGPDGAERIGRR